MLTSVVGLEGGENLLTVRTSDGLYAMTKMDNMSGGSREGDDVSSVDVAIRRVERRKDFRPVLHSARFLLKVTSTRTLSATFIR